MKITDIKTFVVDCFRTNWVFVKVYTDEGIDGVGEGTLEYKEKALVGAIEHIKSYLLGKDPTQIERHYHDIYRDAYWRERERWGEYRFYQFQHGVSRHSRPRGVHCL